MKSSLRLKTNSRKRSLTKEQQTILALFKEKIPDLSWEPEAIHNEIYKISEETKIPIKTAFSAIYQILLGTGERTTRWFLFIEPRETICPRAE